MHSCFTSSIFTARTLDFKVKFGFVFRSEAIVFRRYILALLSVGLLRNFEAYPVYLSLIRSYFLRCFSFFQNFLHFTYMLLWFRLIIPSFPAQIDDMRSRFSALSLVGYLIYNFISNIQRAPVQRLPQYCIAHLYCARFLSHQRAHMSACSCKTWRICLDIELCQLKNGYSAPTSMGTLTFFLVIVIILS